MVMWSIFKLWTIDRYNLCRYISWSLIARLAKWILNHNVASEINACKCLAYLFLIEPELPVFYTLKRDLFYKCIIFNFMSWGKLQKLCSIIKQINIWLLKTSIRFLVILFFVLSYMSNSNIRYPLPQIKFAWVKCIWKFYIFIFCSFFSRKLTNFVLFCNPD